MYVDGRETITSTDMLEFAEGLGRCGNLIVKTDPPLSGHPYFRS